MSLTRDQKRKLEKLSIDKEGVSFVYKHTDRETTVPTIVISLGGLGGETLNILKGKITKNIGKTETIHFLAVDTDDSKDLKQICKSDDGFGHGNLERDETLSLFDPAASMLLARGASRAPEDAQEWLNPAFPARIIDSMGAQGIRQVGRFMLLQPKTFSRVSLKLRSLITKCKESFASGTYSEITVIIIAGVSGGTSGGVIIDFTYLVHAAMAECDITPGNYDISAYLFTPDVQTRVEGIKGNEAIINKLMKNGYAAFKEIDYFYSLKKHGGVYRIKQNGSYRECRENLFTSCTIISAKFGGGVGLTSKDEIIETLSENLLNLLLDVSYSVDCMYFQPLKSFVTIQDENLFCWFQSPDGMNAKFPKAAYYSYNTIGYASVNFPRDEILAYIANKIFESVYGEWKNLGDVDQNAVVEAFANVGGGTFEGFDNYVDTAIITQMYVPIERQISFPDDMYPRKRDFKDNRVLVKEDAEGLAKSLSEHMRNSGLKGAIISRLKGELSRKIDNYFEKKGPYATVDLLTHRMDTFLPDSDSRQPFSGILETLDRMIDAANIRKNEDILAGQGPQIWEGIRRQEDAIKGCIFGIDKKIKTYVDSVCELVEKYTIYVTYYDILIEALTDVYKDLLDTNYQIWEVYIQVLDVVRDILARNSDVATDIKAHQNQSGQIYQFDLLNLYETNQKTENLKKYLDEFIDPVATRKMSEEFIKSMRVHREKWVTSVIDGEFDAETEVQLIFDSFFKDKIGNDLIEKFVVAAYQPNPISPAELSAIWEEKGTRLDIAIKKASDEIVGILTNKGQIMAHVSAPYFMSDFINYEDLVIPRETPHIKHAIEEMKAAGNYRFRILDSEAMCRFNLSSLYINLPLFVFDGFKEYDEAYRNAIANGEIGLHMDEKGEDWSRYPNPYIIDKIAMDGENYKEYKDYKVLEKVKEAVDEALQYGLIYRPLNETYGEARYYYVADIDKSDKTFSVDSDTIKERIKEYVLKDYKDQTNTKPEDNFRIVMESIGYSFNLIPLIIDYVGLDKLDFTAEGGEATGKYVPIGDLYKLVRMSIYYTDKLYENLEYWRRIKEIYDNAKADLLKR